jgi:hypothetical protein
MFDFVWLGEFDSLSLICYLTGQETTVVAKKSCGLGGFVRNSV